MNLQSMTRGREDLTPWYVRNFDGSLTVKHSYESAMFYRHLWECNIKAGGWRTNWTRFEVKKLPEVFTFIKSNGSPMGAFDSKEPKGIDLFLLRLQQYPLDRTFEAYGDFIKENPRSWKTKKLLYPVDVIHFWGNFKTFSHGFDIVTNDPDVISVLVPAIWANKEREDYLSQEKPKKVELDEDGHTKE